MHLGIIPDGNRRWCKSHGKSWLGLVAHHSATIARTLMSRHDLCRDHPELGDIREMSLYMLSADNLSKRTDTTLDMVFGMLETMHLAAIAASLLRRLEAADISQPQEAGRVRYVIETTPSSAGVVTITVDTELLLPDCAIAPDVPALTDVMCVKIDVSPRMYDALPSDWAKLLRDVSNPTSAEDPVLRIRHVSEAPDAIATRMESAGVSVHVDCSCDGSVAYARSLLHRMSASIAGIEVRFHGEMSRLPERQRLQCETIERLFSSGSVRVNIAIAYDPIEDMRRFVMGDDRMHRMSPIDLVIRTSGEQRSSGFFPVHTLYSEWIYVPHMFPDLTIAHVVDALANFRARDRRWGG